MQCPGALRALLVCAAVAVPAFALPAAAQAGFSSSCGSFQTLNPTGNPPDRVELDPGDALDYDLESHDATLETATIDWGDGGSSSIDEPLPPNTTVTVPNPQPYTYDDPGTFEVFLTVTGHFPDGTPCGDRVHLGTVVVSSGSEQGSSCGVCHPPSVTTAKRKCNGFLRKATGRVGRIYRRGKNKKTTCKSASGNSRTCTTTVVYPPCGCRYTITTRVPARGKPHVIRIRRKKLRGHSGSRVAVRLAILTR